MDPAAEHFDYNPLVDVRELIHVDDAMEDEDLHFGPNGGLVFCMEYLLKNSDWLREELGDVDEDYILFDCPGQIELYTHMNTMKEIVELLQKWGFRICAVFLIDAQFMVDGAKFISGNATKTICFSLVSKLTQIFVLGTMAALSVMINLELPHVNILSKMDQLQKFERRQLDGFLDPDPHFLLGSMESKSKWNQKYQALTEAIGQIIEDYSLVRFHALNIKNEENLGDILLTIDNVLQYGEDADVKTHDFEYPDEDNGND